MADESQVGGTDTTHAEGAAAHEPSPVETKARELGWIPKEEYEGDETNWLDAGEFVRRQPLFEKIEKQNRELKEVKRVLTKFSEHHARVKEIEYKRALETLKAKKVEAYEEGNAGKIVEIDEQIDAVKQEQKQFVEEQSQQVREEASQIHPEFEAWTNRNTWYTTDRAMKAFADTLGEDIAKKGGKSPAEVLKEVEKRVREEFPHRFKNQNRDKPGAVEGTSSKGTGAPKGYVPTDAERAIARKFVKQNLFKTEEEYYKELQKLNGKS